MLTCKMLLKMLFLEYSKRYLFQAFKINIKERLLLPQCQEKFQKSPFWLLYYSLSVKDLQTKCSVFYN